MCAAILAACRAAAPPEAPSIAEAPRSSPGAGGAPGALVALAKRAPAWMVLDLDGARRVRGGAAILRALAYLPLASSLSSASGVAVPADVPWCMYDARDATWPTTHTLVLGHRPAVTGSAHPTAHTFAMAPEAERDAVFAAASDAPELGLAPGVVGAAHADDAAPLLLGESKALRALDATLAVSGDGMELAATITCESAETCARMADGLRRHVAKLNGPFVRSALHHLLDPLTAEGLRAEGDRLRIALHASDEQLAAVASMLGAYLGAPVDD